MSSSGTDAHDDMDMDGHSAAQGACSAAARVAITFFGGDVNDPSSVSPYYASSDLAHHVLGVGVFVLVLVYGVFVTGRLRITRTLKLAGATLMTMGAYLLLWVFFFMFPENPRALWGYVTSDATQWQHMAIAALLLAAGWVEFCMGLGVLVSPDWFHVSSTAVALIGVIFLVHPQHSRSSTINHVFLGALLVIGALFLSESKRSNIDAWRERERQHAQLAQRRDSAPRDSTQRSPTRRGGVLAEQGPAHNADTAIVISSSCFGGAAVILVSFTETPSNTVLLHPLACDGALPLVIFTFAFAVLVVLLPPALLLAAAFRRRLARHLALLRLDAHAHRKLALRGQPAFSLGFGDAHTDPATDPATDPTHAVMAEVALQMEQLRKTHGPAPGRGGVPAPGYSLDDLALAADGSPDSSVSPLATTTAAGSPGTSAASAAAALDVYLVRAARPEDPAAFFDPLSDPIAALPPALLLRATLAFALVHGCGLWDLRDAGCCGGGCGGFLAWLTANPFVSADVVSVDEGEVEDEGEREAGEENEEARREAGAAVGRGHMEADGRERDPRRGGNGLRSQGKSRSAPRQVARAARAAALSADAAAARFTSVPVADDEEMGFGPAGSSEHASTAHSSWRTGSSAPQGAGRGRRGVERDEVADQVVMIDEETSGAATGVVPSSGGPATPAARTPRVVDVRTLLAVSDSEQEAGQEAEQEAGRDTARDTARDGGRGSGSADTAAGPGAVPPSQEQLFGRGLS